MEEPEGEGEGQKEEGQNGAVAKEKYGQGEERGKALSRSDSPVTGHIPSPPPHVFTSPSVRSDPPELQPIALPASLLPSLR